MHIMNKTILRGENSVERPRCMELLVHAYQVQGSDLNSLMVALTQLNTVEEAEEDIHEVLYYIVWDPL